MISNKPISKYPSAASTEIDTTTDIVPFVSTGGNATRTITFQNFWRAIRSSFSLITSSYADKNNDTIYITDATDGATKQMTLNELNNTLSLSLRQISSIVRRASTLANTSDALLNGIIDFNIVGANKSWKLGLYTFLRNDPTYGHWIRIAAFRAADGTLDTSIGTNGIVAEWRQLGYTEPSAVDGRIVDTITFANVYGGVVRGKIVVDWALFTAGATNYAPQNYFKHGFSERLTARADSDTIGFKALPRGEAQLWERNNLFALGNLNEAIIDCQIYGGTRGTRYGIETLRYTPVGPDRSYIAICDYDANGTKIARRCIWDNTLYTPPTAVNGCQIDTVYLNQYNSSGISARITIDWAKIPTSGTGWAGNYWASNVAVTDAEFSMNVCSTETAKVVGSNVVDFQIDGINARITTSTGYDSKGDPDYLLILCHGNGGNYTYAPSTRFINFCKAHKISYACISTQDYTASPFGSTASGWGNDVVISRNIKLYNYLMGRFNLHKSVIIAGASMGGLAMGTLAYTRPFPILFCMGIGPVPSLEYMFIHGSGRQESIRNAYGMSPDGRDDANILQFIQGYDWYYNNLLTIDSTLYKPFPTRLYMYLGTGDTTATVEFGGIAKYNEIRDAINGAGGYCVTKDVGAYVHADAHIYDVMLDDLVFKRELGIVE